MQALFRRKSLMQRKNKVWDCNIKDVDALGDEPGALLLGEILVLL